MTDADMLLKQACKDPTDSTLRKALADELQSVNEHELASVIEDDDTGPKYLIDLKGLSNEINLPATVKLLWSLFFVLPRCSVYRPDWRSTPTGIVTNPTQPPTPEEIQRAHAEIQEAARRYQRPAAYWNRPFPASFYNDPSHWDQTWNTAAAELRRREGLPSLQEVADGLPVQGHDAPITHGTTDE